MTQAKKGRRSKELKFKAAADIFAGASEKKGKASQSKDELLIKTIGKQQVHIDWLKKKLGVSDFELDNL